jgi:hypothetical protein
MYVLDAERGRGRRALARHGLVHPGQEVGDLGEDAHGWTADLHNRAPLPETRGGR